MLTSVWEGHISKTFSASMMQFHTEKSSDRLPDVVFSAVVSRTESSFPSSRDNKGRQGEFASRRSTSHCRDKSFMGKLVFLFLDISKILEADQGKSNL